LALGKDVNLQVWNTANIQSTKARIKEDLDRLDQSDPRSRADLILKRLADLEDRDDPQARLETYVLAMSALVLHERKKVLKEKLVATLFELADDVLTAQQIADDSRLGFLRGELNLVKSQIFLAEGKTWESLWSVYDYHHSLQRYANRDDHHLALGLGIRSIRLGEGSVAAEYFAFAARSPIPRIQQQAQVYAVMTARLQGLLDESLKLAALSRGETVTSSTIELELQWETISRDVIRSGELKPLLRASLKGGSHYQRDYLLESFLWAFAHQSENYLSNLPKIKTLRRDDALAISSGGFDYEVVRVFESLYDRETNFDRRLQSLGSLLKSLGQLTSISKELLTWLAAARWLSRLRHPLD
jgi:hypothetical protein